MTQSIPQSNFDPLLHQWQGTAPVQTVQQFNEPLVGKIQLPAPPPVVPAPVPPVVEPPVNVAPRFTVTDQTVTILHGGSEFVYQGHQTTHRIHKDANGVEHIFWQRAMHALPTLNIQVVRRDTVAKD